MTSTGTPTYMPSPTAATSTTPPASDLHISSTRRVSAPKDRQCRFCGQWFTASSLGRHYDQWVKPVNPKPPDGIHDVTLIAQMRGTITRRTRNRDKKGVGTALGLREEGGEKNAEGGSGGTTSSDGLEAGQKKTGGDGVEKLEGVTRVQKKVEELMGIRFNHIPWYISGVMKDLPPQHTPPASGLAQDSSSAQTGSSPGEASKQDGLVVALEERQKKVAEDLENGRAAELALTDILGSVQEASLRVSRQPLFDFDLFTHNFPSLCLLILPPPPTLHSTTPFPSPGCWPLQPPSESELTALNAAVQERASTLSTLKSRNIRISSVSSDAPNAPAPPTGAPSILGTPVTTATPPVQTSTPPLATFSAHVDRVKAHVLAAWNQWQTLSPSQQEEAWRLELLRNFARAEEARRRGDAAIDALRNEVDELWIKLQAREERNSAVAAVWEQQGIDALGFATKGSAGADAFGLGSAAPSWGLPLARPGMMRLSGEAVKALVEQGTDPAGVEVDDVLAAYRRIVKAERGPDELYVGRNGPRGESVWGKALRRLKMDLAESEAGVEEGEDEEADEEGDEEDEMDTEAGNQRSINIGTPNRAIPATARAKPPAQIDTSISRGSLLSPLTSTPHYLAALKLKDPSPRKGAFASSATGSSASPLSQGHGTWGTVNGALGTDERMEGIEKGS